MTTMAERTGHTFPPNVPLWAERFVVETSTAKRKVWVNEMERTWGPGPDGTTCSECIYLIKVHPKYLKCERRWVTSGYGTDHFAGWPTCSLFVEKAS